jgi:uncharacterized protein YcnI
MSAQRHIQRVAAATAVVGATGLLSAGLASAHVTANVYGSEPTQGGYGAVVLRVPNEEMDAGTSKVEVSIPAEYGITSGRTKPVPGWTAEVVKTPTQEGDVVTSISWTAEPGNEIPAGPSSYQEFSMSLGKLPEDVDTLVLPAAQTYTDGKVVNWDDPPAGEGAPEPENPAPTVELAPAGAGGHGHGSGDAAEDASPQAAADDNGSADSTARWLGGAGLAVGALGLGFGAGAMLRTRKAAK